MSSGILNDTLFINRKGCHMDNSIFHQIDYGKVTITLKNVMEQKEMTRNKLANLTGLVYNTINRYYQSAPITSVDLDVLAKICYVLDCDVKDVLQYERPQKSFDEDNVK